MQKKELEKLFLLFKSFSKYTSIPSDVMSKYLSVKINIDAFIKKKWNKHRNKFSSLESYFGKGKKATLTDDEIKDIKKFEHKVMNGWVTSIGLTGGDLKGEWATNEFRKIVQNNSITDTAIRDDYMKDEFGIKPSQRQGMFEWNTGETTKKSNQNLLPLSKKSYGNQTFGNNATATKFYSGNGDWTRLKPKLTGPLMEQTLHYNCNSPNVADPASSCPELFQYDGVGNITITLNAGPNNVIVYKLEGAKLKKDLSGKIEILERAKKDLKELEKTEKEYKKNITRNKKLIASNTKKIRKLKKGTDK